MGNAIVIHLTQGSTLAGAKATLERNRSWSNTLYDPETGEEHVFTESSKGDRSLRNLAGGVETNNRPGVYQIEIVGFSQMVQDYSDDWYANLAAYLQRKANDWNVPYVFPHEFLGVNEAYGTRAKSRLSHKQWLALEGIVGHQHVPENTHWDPGPILVGKLTAAPPAPTTHPDAASNGPQLANWMAEIEALCLHYRGRRLNEEEYANWLADLTNRIYIKGEQDLSGVLRWWHHKLSEGG